MILYQATGILTLKGALLQAKIERLKEERRGEPKPRGKVQNVWSRQSRARLAKTLFQLLPALRVGYNYAITLTYRQRTPEESKQDLRKLYKRLQYLLKNQSWFAIWKMESQTQGNRPLPHPTPYRIRNEPAAAANLHQPRMGRNHRRHTTRHHWHTSRPNRNPQSRTGNDLHLRTRHQPTQSIPKPSPTRRMDRQMVGRLEQTQTAHLPNAHHLPAAASTQTLPRQNQTHSQTLPILILDILRTRTVPTPHRSPVRYPRRRDDQHPSKAHPKQAAKFPYRQPDSSKPTPSPGTPAIRRRPSMIKGTRAALHHASAP